MIDIKVQSEVFPSPDGTMADASSRLSTHGGIPNADAEHAWMSLWKRGLEPPSRLVVVNASQGSGPIGYWPMVMHAAPGLGVVLDAVAPDGIGLCGMQLVAPRDLVCDVMLASIRTLLDTGSPMFDALRISGVRDGIEGLPAIRAAVEGNTKWDCKEEQVLVGGRMLLRPGPDGGQLWPLTFRPAAKAASAAFQSGDVALDAGDGVPTHVLANLQKFFHLQGESVWNQGNPSERGVDPTLPMRVLQRVAWESLSDDPDAELALSAGNVHVPLLLWKSKPVAGAVVQTTDRVMRVHAMVCGSDRPKQSLVWLLHWAMSQNAIALGMRSIEYASNLLEEVGHLRCEKIFATRVCIRQRSVLHRIQRAMQSTARGGGVRRALKRPGPSPQRGVYG